MQKHATVLSFDRVRGIGWGLPDDGGNDVFIHRDRLPPDHRYLNEGDRISYEIGEYNGRSCAVKIRYLGTIARQVSEGGGR